MTDDDDAAGAAITRAVYDCPWVDRDRVGHFVISQLWLTGRVVVDAARVADLERKNANLGRLAAGGAPRGYSLVKEGGL